MKVSSQIIEAFLKEEPPAWGAPSDDRTEYGIEWNFSNGSVLWLDFDADGKISVLWRTKDMAEPYQASIET